MGIIIASEVEHVPSAIERCVLTFRIKIWDKDNGGTVVYDNNVGGGGDDGYVGGTVIGGGNIKVHNK